MLLGIASQIYLTMEKKLCRLIQVLVFSHSALRYMRYIWQNLSGRPCVFYSAVNLIM